jgi:transcriptional/translational regulatory protein YebC/TACO1
MTRDGDQFEILTDPSAFYAVTEAQEKDGISALRAEVSLVPDTYVPVTEKNVAASVLKFVEALEDNDDVQNVYTNMDVSDEVLSELEAE